MIYKSDTRTKVETAHVDKDASVNFETFKISFKQTETASCRVYTDVNHVKKEDRCVFQLQKKQVKLLHV